MAKGSCNQTGGSLITSVTDLAIPFSLLIAQKGLTKWMKDADKNGSKKEKPKTKPRKTSGGAGAKGCQLCSNNMHRGGMIHNANLAKHQVKSEFQRLSNELKSLFEKY